MFKKSQLGTTEWHNSKVSGICRVDGFRCRFYLSKVQLDNQTVKTRIRTRTANIKKKHPVNKWDCKTHNDTQT